MSPIVDFRDSPARPDGPGRGAGRGPAERPGCVQGSSEPEPRIDDPDCRRDPAATGPSRAGAADRDDLGDDIRINSPRPVVHDDERYSMPAAMRAISLDGDETPDVVGEARRLADRAASATWGFDVSTLTGTFGQGRADRGTTGTTRASSSSRVTGEWPGLVDSPPVQNIGALVDHAPRLGNRVSMARADSVETSVPAPASPSPENESGVTFTMPMTKCGYPTRRGAVRSSSVRGRERGADHGCLP